MSSTVWWCGPGSSKDHHPDGAAVVFGHSPLCLLGDRAAPVFANGVLPIHCLFPKAREPIHSLEDGGTAGGSMDDGRGHACFSVWDGFNFKTLERKPFIHPAVRGYLS